MTFCDHAPGAISDVQLVELDFDERYAGNVWQWRVSIGTDGKRMVVRTSKSSGSSLFRGPLRAISHMYALTSSQTIGYTQG